MRIKILLTTTFLTVAGLAFGENVPTITPTPSPTPNFTPWPTNTPLVAPTWAPESAGPVPEKMKAKKPSPWMSAMGLGACFPMSSRLNEAYATAFDASLGTGLKVDSQFSLWMNLNLALFNSKSVSLTGQNNYNLIAANFWARYRILDSDFSPYLFAGPGVAYNENRSSGGAVYDPSTGSYYIPVNSYEVDFIAEGGLGFEMRLGGGIAGYLQGKLTYDFTSSHFAGDAHNDSPVIVMPLELGILFGI